MESYGKITAVTGPMRSHKSAYLIKTIEEENKKGKKYLAFKPEADSRDKNKIISRNGSSLSENVFLIKNLKDAQKIIEKKRFIGKSGWIYDLDTIIFDEFHFFDKDEDIAPLFHHWSAHKIEIIVAGLDLSHSGVPMAAMAKALSLADNVYKLRAICDFSKNDNATMTGMKNFIPDDFIPGDENYISLCKKHWYDKMIAECPEFKKKVEDIVGENFA